jgi:competence protein ComGC
MAWAGYCDQCRENVWLNADGSCPRGHTADHISAAYEAGPPPQAAPQPQQQPYQQPQPYQPAQYPVPPGQEPPRKKSHTGVVVAAVVVLGLLLLCGLMAAMPMLIFSKAKSSAQQRVCFANQRTVSGASQAYMADNGALPKTLKALIDAGLIESEPVCPNGGTYTWDEMTGEITCSIHGSYKTGGREPPTQ